MKRPVLGCALVITLIHGIVRHYQSFVSSRCLATANLCHDKYSIDLQFVHCYRAENPLTSIETQTSSVSEAVLGAREVRLCESLPTQLSSYPPGIFRRAGLKRIVICKELSLLGDVCGGLTRSQEGIIFFNSLLYDGKRSKNDPERCFHHELFHLLDHAMGFSDITKYDELAGFERDPEWEELNDEGFQYDPRWSIHYSRLEATAIKPGIWTYYSLSSPAEDKAVLFSYMVIAYDKLKELSKKDEILERKISLLSRRLLRFDAFFDENFWVARARAGREKRDKTRASAFHLTNGACAWSCTWCRRVSTDRPLESCLISPTIVSSCSTRSVPSSSWPRAARSSRSDAT
jgi:hypothetical protein